MVKHYFTIKDLQKALDIVGKEIMIYELNKIIKKCKKYIKFKPKGISKGL